MKWRVLVAAVLILTMLLSCIPKAPAETTTKSTITPGISVRPIQGIPATSASAITSPPPSMVGINSHTEVYAMGADPDMITLGPKVGGNPQYTPYATHLGTVFELKHGTPLLAPIDMVLVGFLDKNNYWIRDGQKVRNSDLNLFFESASPDWPGMIMRVYHIYSSPLLIGHDGSAIEEWVGTIQAQGHIFDPFDDYFTPGTGNASACEALIGYTVKRGELIGFAGTMPAGVGTHSFADFCFKVSDTSENPTVKTGNRYLHWVQAASFFYWKSYSPDADFPSGVLAYPFECDGYQLPAEQHDVNFKYTAKK